jgi:hypothetical protein
MRSKVLVISDKHLYPPEINIILVLTIEPPGPLPLSHTQRWVNTAQFLPSDFFNWRHDYHTLPLIHSSDT